MFVTLENKHVCPKNRHVGMHLTNISFTISIRFQRPNNSKAEGSAAQPTLGLMGVDFASSGLQLFAGLPSGLSRDDVSWKSKRQSHSLKTQGMQIISKNCRLFK